MKIWLMLLACLFIVSCNKCKYDENNFKESFGQVQTLNQVLLVTVSAGQWSDDLSELKKRIRTSTSSVEQLEKKLSLCDVQRYYLGNDSNRVGLAYKFVSDRSKPECYYYLLYAKNALDKEELVSYEQFADFRDKRVDFDQHWVWLRINRFND